MLKIQEIREIIKLIDQSSIEKFSYEADGAKLVLKKGSTEQVVSAVQTEPITEVPAALPAPVQEVPVAAPQKEAPKASVEAVQDPSLHEITSPMVGTFYSASSPEAEAYVKSGDKVSENSIVCIVEAMKLFNEIEAEVSGEIVEILAEDGQLVEYGQPLFLVKTK
ncbi:acetyl-CoA carboxylase biotin carboxyl carrier protein [Sporosarcina sp. Marseille-Q4063]|uniref:acetyl-CoA carboxylase biotin carboxyl carrier protein n=1 Tax=Sporosarcina sp. Marseille-Q4063 TaxID=2810514 RepID=UPI001BAF6AE1|nr:acetyl-CoA carboxylase biotin carboxyl carrier protein [Sporosarcina sp. Marseille-Q4063]QUW22278.1 acetyl-CoA carboxylase biotin carboxyl carrier protein [Sporosarcina sp. Marseille-Q4063]